MLKKRIALAALASTVAVLIGCAPAKVSISVKRADPGQTVYPDVLATATVLDANGKPWQGALLVEAFNPDGYFNPPPVSAVTSIGNGQYTATVECPRNGSGSCRSGEVTIRATAKSGSTIVQADKTVLFLPFVAEGWGVPAAVSEINTAGSEDSVGISRDGKTLFFSYTPLSDCRVMSDPPDWPSCAHAYGPYLPPKRPDLHGVNPDGSVTVGLYGDTLPPPEGNGWPFSKYVMTGYAASRNSDGVFGDPVGIGFTDDGVIPEASLVSGPVSLAPGKAYELFFAFPDWLDFNGDGSGRTLYCVARGIGGEPLNLGTADPRAGWEGWGHWPPDTVAQELTGGLRDYLLTHDMGEFRVYQDAAGGYALYYETKRSAPQRMACETQGDCDPGFQCDPENKTCKCAADGDCAAAYPDNPYCVNGWCEDDSDLVVSPLSGDYPAGPWDAGSPLPAPLNTPEANEFFPWIADLSTSGSTRTEIFFARGPVHEWTEPVRLLASVLDHGSWSEPTTVVEPELSVDKGSIFMATLPAVAESDAGTEMFFVYVIFIEFYNGDRVRLNFQIGVLAREG